MKIRNLIKRKQFIKNIEVALYDAKESLNTEIKKNSKGEYDYWYYLGAYSFAQSLDKAIKINGMIYLPANHKVAEACYQEDRANSNKLSDKEFIEFLKRISEN